MLIPRKARAEEEEEVGSTDLARRVLAHAATPEEKLEALLAERRKEIEEQAGRLEDAMTDLERREELLRDMRSSVERLLRLGVSDFTAREVELQDLSQEFMQRADRLSAEEEALNRRRSELGAVELKREAVERRERAVAAREAALEEPGARSAEEQPETHRPPATEHPSTRVTSVFVPGAAYRLVEIEPRELERGAELELEGKHYVVARIGRSPLPASSGLCAYLELDAEAASVSGGNS